ncbi:MAG TPA: hypothetical protein VG056_02920, partial [Pirellulales bacterium]|nr:hypothetical protein [Pirellulales bacterium]
MLIDLFSSSALAGTNGTWIDATTGGLWSSSANWSGGTIADGTDGIADFSTLNIAADNTVHLDTARTIGTLKFGDTTPSNNWTLDNNGNSPNILTMAVSSGSPLIQVNNQTATISAILAGSQGLTTVGNATGDAVLTLAGANSYSGGTTIANAARIVANASTTQSGGVITSGPLGTGVVTIGPANLMLGTSSGLTLANPIVVSD